MIWSEPPVGTEGSVAPRFHLPAGTVTFLMSDIEGSTRLWSAFPETMGSAVGDVYGILDRAISRYGGVRPVEQGEGDSVVGAFSRASDAVAAAVQAQQDLHSHEWPAGMQLRVRIALHTADAQLRDEGNYFGLALSRCARLRAVARGGQTLLSRGTRDLVADGLLAGVELLDCGVHRLRDLGRPEHVFALVQSGLDGDPGPLLSVDAFPNNLPSQLTSFVGRAHELEQLRDVLADTRLLTLTGAGGAGKTRLALQVAADALEQFEDGVWWVELAPVANAELVGEMLAAALGVRPLATMTALQASCLHLAGLRALVILDNCEHLLTAGAAVAEAILRSCPDVVVIATSRTQLGVAGETDWRVPSLSLPESEPERAPLEVLGQSDAVRLFIERARKARPNFAVTDESAPAVAEICYDLDGLPLAIELAAARVRMMSVQQIAAGLGDRFHLLTGGTRTALPRHQTLRASVDWSHELLSEPERALLRRLAVFAGGFTLDLAEATCPDEVLERMAILDVLASLVDKSLVVAEERGATVRYRLLETVRQYSLERLIEVGEAARMRDCHRDAMLVLAERIAPELHLPRQREWLEILDNEAANFAVALDHAAKTDAGLALRLCVALTFWWKGRGLFVPAERAFERALGAGDQAPSPLRAHVLWGRGYLAAYAGRHAPAIAALQEAKAMSDVVGDQVALGRTLMALGFVQMFADPLGSRPINERAREVARDCGDDWALICANMNLACVHILRGELDEAEALLDETLPLSERHGYLELQAWYWFFTSIRAWAAADIARVSERTAKALEFARAAGEPTTEAFAQGLVANLELAKGMPEAAEQRMRATYARALEAGGDFALGCTVTWLAQAQAALGDIAGARAALEQVTSTGIDGGFVLATATVALADLLRASGNLTAEARASEALTIGQRVGTPWVIANANEVLGRLAVVRGEWSSAEALLHDVLCARIEHELLLWLPQTFDALAEIAAGLGSHEEAARTLGIADRSRDELSLVRWGPDAARCFAELEQTVRQQLGDDAYELAYAEGRELPPEDALIWVRRARGERKRPARGWESLTPTELRVIQLVCEGLTNPQIGERMFISRGTVKVHLSHIFAKLGTATRAELAADAVRRSHVN
jgi:predicted ATPase/class 3 adenylate cyclase/DNA-binding CsgD family transcriptional regulator